MKLQNKCGFFWSIGSIFRHASDRVCGVFLLRGTTDEHIYQLIGFGALIAMGLSYWQNDKRTILLWQVVANLIFAIHYTLLHARSGALCSFFQIVVLLLFLLQEKFNWSRLVTAIPIVAVFLLIAVVTYETPVTVLPIVASLAALLPVLPVQAAGDTGGGHCQRPVVAGVCHCGTVVFRHGDRVGTDHHHGGVPAEEGIQKALNGQIPRHIAGGSVEGGGAASGVVLQPLRHG